MRQLVVRPRAALALAALALALGVVPAQAATYTVRSGDTLTGIAARHHVSLHRLARINHINPYGIIVVGQRLRVPGSTPHRRRTHRRTHRRVHRRHVRSGVHTVRAGESLASIAHRYHSSVRILARFNHRGVHQVLLVGTRLHIPLPHHVRHHARRVHRRHHHARPARMAWPVREHWSVVRIIDYWARRYSIDRHLVRAIGWQESGYNPRAVSSVGATGVLQVMPGTWLLTERNLIGHSVPHTAAGGIHVGVAYLRSLLRIFHGNVRLSVGAYYQGPGAIEQYGIFASSEFYVRNVLWLRQRL
jgi:LysM repeat protein